MLNFIISKNKKFFLFGHVLYKNNTQKKNFFFLRKKGKPMKKFFSRKELIKKNPRLSELPSWFFAEIVEKLESIYQDLSSLEKREVPLEELYNRLSQDAVAFLIGKAGFFIVLDYVPEYMEGELLKLVQKHNLDTDRDPGLLFLRYCPDEDDDEDEDDDYMGYDDNEDNDDDGDEDDDEDDDYMGYDDNEDNDDEDVGFHPGYDDFYDDDAHYLYLL